jgi:hypothetical protein
MVNFTARNGIFLVILTLGIIKMAVSLDCWQCQVNITYAKNIYF